VRSAACGSSIALIGDPELEELTRVYSDRYDVKVEAGGVILTPKLTAEASPASRQPSGNGRGAAVR